MQHPSLYYFLITAEYLNISEAAQQIPISQQGLSAYIKRLEEFYQTELFTRKPSLALTPAGQLVFEAARQIEEIHEQLVNSLKAQISSEEQLRLGITPELLQVYGDQLPLLTFRNRCPNVLLTLREQETATLEKLLLTHQLDLYVGEAIPDEPRLTADSLFSLDCALVISDPLMKIYFPEEYPYCLNRLRRGVSLNEFSSVPYFGYPAEHHISEILAAHAHKTGVDLTLSGENPSLTLNLNMVLHEEGYTICPTILANAYRRSHKDNPLLHVFPIKTPDFRRQAVLVRRSEMGADTPLAVLASLLKEVAHNFSL